MLPRRKTRSTQIIRIASGMLISTTTVRTRSSVLDGAGVVVAAPIAAKIDIGLVRLTVPPVCGGGLYGVAGAIPMASVLDEILAHKRDEIAQRKNATPLDVLKETIAT